MNIVNEKEQNMIYMDMIEIDLTEEVLMSI